MRISIFIKKGCKTCKQLENYLKENHPTAAYEILDVNNPDMVKKYEIKTAPTIILEGITGEIKKMSGFNILTTEILDNVIKKNS